MTTATPKTAIVTGGSRGIGAAICRKAAAAGYNVVLTYNTDAAAADAVAADIRNAGVKALTVKADMAVEKDILGLFEEVDRQFGSLDLLVANAGGTGKICRVEDVTASALTELLAANVVGVFLCCREAVKRMSTRHGGRGGAIVTMSSRAAGLGGGGEWVHYAASKGAIDSLTFGLAREVAAEDIRVNAVAPGLIDTSIHAAAGAPDRVTRLAPLIPIPRAGEPEEVADVVMWLASDTSSYVTGAVIPVSGGR
ncbi:Glucose 1-dehydrogenase 1 [Hartmannibacter diazotrophicus]|uniref:Glucose 1-dehydrogenase 1 n=1 Tax=Hartmannibacter diazotrophicus TaxID=1482074 RepID=A0A2C9D962_9HYPH|nr:SDR family oxidoreductase [Hartmannibacter diazotrophicus]SON56688.1 Glucose 1-dehydrogenase 1 [Hartmannibacter diazotrophicus]